MNLQYITQEIQNKPHWQLAKEACEAGVDWVQLRIKNKSFETWLEAAQQTKAVTDSYGAKLIINDSLEIALAVRAAGVHLGKEDISVQEARKVVLQNFIVGGTANTFHDVKELVKAGADYIGLGPFRFTTTKSNLSPILGVEGYKRVLQQCLLHGIHVPIIAIGGITPEDVPEILASGVYGIAVSSAITRHDNKKMVVEAFKKRLQLPCE